MAVDAFYIDIEDSSGNRQGAGPILSAEGWTYTARMDRAGSFSFAMPASDDMADEVQKKRVARAYALLGSTWTEVGAGIIDNITKAPGPDGRVMLSVSGDDELRQLTYRSVGFLELESAGGAITHSAAVTAIDAYKPSGWTLTADTSPGNDNIYGRYAGETVLQALVALGEKSQSHFYRSGAKALTFASTFSDSGIRAIQAGGDLSAATCAIVDLQERIDTHDLVTRIYPYGAGQGQARLTLAPTTRSAGAGFTLSTANNYIENDTAEATYGRIERYLEYKDVAPISNSDADLQAAANMLYDVALEELKRRSTELEQATYTLRLAQCRTLMRPLQTVRVVYWDPDAGMDVDADLNILEATLQVDADGLRTTGLVVSNADRWPDNDSDIVASEMAQGMIFQAHPQMNANSYTTAYSKPVDSDENASVYFRLGDEVVQVQQVAFDFQLLPFESTVRQVAAPGTTAGSGELTTESATGDTGASNDSSGPATGDTGAAIGDTGNATGNTGQVVGDTGQVVGNTGTSAVDSGTAIGNTGTSSANSGAATGDTGGSGTLTTNSPEGGDVVSAGQHQHTFLVTGNSTITYNIGFSAAGPGAGLVSEYTSDANIITNQQGDHTHTLGAHTHTLNDHSHTLNNHTHTLNNHSHTLGNHSHTLGNHSHTLGLHSHTLGLHSHTLGDHSHTLGNHVHTLNNHTHTLNNHAHAFDVKLSTLFGIYRESSRNTAALADMEYRVNGGTWTVLDSDATSLGGSWYRLDVTSDVVDSVTLRPVQTDNTIEFRIEDQSASPMLEIEEITVEDGTATGSVVTEYEAAQAGDRVELVDTGAVNEDGFHTIVSYSGGIVTWRTTGFEGLASGLTAEVLHAYTVQIDGLLSVRNTIQAVAYT